MNITPAAAILGFSGLLLAHGAAGQTVQLAVIPDQSLISVTIELETPGGSRSSFDSSPVEGVAVMEFNNTGMPTSVTLRSFRFTARDELGYDYDYGGLGSITGVGTGLGLRQPVASTPTTGTVDGTGAFVISDVPSQTLGTFDASGTGAIGATIGTVAIDLSTLGSAQVEATGAVFIVGDQVSVTLTVPLAATSQVQPGVTTNITGSATVVAAGVIDVCLGDTNGDGIINPADFTAWIIAYNNQSPVCDQNADGLCTPADFSAWIIRFNAGC